MSGCITSKCWFWNQAQENCELRESDDEEFFRYCPCAPGNESVGELMEDDE